MSDIADEEANYQRAVQIVISRGVANPPMLQRLLTIGYNQACRHIERMEGEGLVSKPDASGKRAVHPQPLAHMTPAPAAGETLDNLLDRYFEIAYQQGVEGRSHDDIAGSAQETIDKIRACFDQSRRIPATLKAPIDRTVGGDIAAVLEEMRQVAIAENRRGEDEWDGWNIDNRAQVDEWQGRIRSALSNSATEGSEG